MLMSDEGHNQRQTQGGYNSSHGHLDQMGQKVRLSISQLFASSKKKDNKSFNLIQNVITSSSYLEMKLINWCNVACLLNRIFLVCT